MSLPRLRLSALPPFDAAQRLFSRIIWGAWLGAFLFLELLGTLRWTPWRTLSETGWDAEDKHPDTVRALQGFLLGLTVHIRYRTTLESSVELGMALQDDFDAWIKERDEWRQHSRSRGHCTCSGRTERQRPPSSRQSRR